MRGPGREVLSSWSGRLWHRSSVVDRQPQPWPSARRIGVSVCRCVGVTLLCDTRVGGRPGQARPGQTRIENQESSIEMLHPPLPPASDRFGRLQATGCRHEEGFLRCESLPTGCIVTIPVPISGFLVSGFPGFLSIVQQRPVSKPERLLEPLALEPCRAEPCYVMLCCVVFFYRDTKCEIRNVKCETRAQESRTQKSRIQEPKNPRIKNQGQSLCSAACAARGL